MNTFPLTTAMLFAAGLGSRLKPFTNNHPKALAVVNNKTLLERNILYLKGFGIKNIIINVHHFAEQIINFLNSKNFEVNILISHEKDEVLETGGGLKNAVSLFNDSENLLVMNVDVLTSLDIVEMYKFHVNNNAHSTLAITNRETSRNLVFDAHSNLVGWYNNQTNESKGIAFFRDDLHFKFAFSGIHIINKLLYKNIPLNGKFSMIDLYLNCLNNYSIKGFNHSKDLFFDVGRNESIKNAEQYFL